MSWNAPDLGAKVVGSLAVVAVGSMISKAFGKHPVVGAVVAFVVTAVVKPEAVVLASDIGL
jgi:hypothetical protein